MLYEKISAILELKNQLTTSSFLETSFTRWILKNSWKAMLKAALTLQLQLLPATDEMHQDLEL